MNCNIIVLEQRRKSWETTKGNYLYNNDYNALHEKSALDDTLAAPADDHNDDDVDGNDNGNDGETESVETTESDRVNTRVLWEM